MSEKHTSFQDAPTEEQAKYLVHSRYEVSQILRDLMQQKQIVTGCFNQSQSFFLSAMLDADPER